MSAPEKIAGEDRIPVGQKLAYAAGGSVEMMTNASVGPMWMPVFNLGFGISPGVLGIIGVIYRIWDAITDPVVGNMSDNTRTRWGRRRPYIFVGAIMTAVVTPMLWRLSPNWSEMGMLIYITVVGLLLHTSLSVWAMPYNSLMLEMTPNYDERTRVSAYRTVFMKFGVLVGSWILPFAASPLFGDPLTGKSDLVRGVQIISIGLAVATIALGVLPAIFIPERYYHKEASKQAKEPLIRGIRDSFSLRPLWLLISIVVFQVFGNGLTSAMGFYINLYYVNAGKLTDAAVIEGFKGSTAFVVGLAAVPFWTWVCERLDKKWTLMIIVGSGFVAAGLNLLCITPGMPYLQIVPAVFYASVTASIWLILPSMLADIVDLDELKTNRRREGNINAVFSWFFKLGGTVAMGLSGFILEWTGFDAKLGAQPEAVLHRMLLLYILLPTIFWIVAVILIGIYPLNRKKMSEIRAELESRRGAV
jgi:GPH family glycoside/pentoside/hexuronide:cation symporter